MHVEIDAIVPDFGRQSRMQYNSFNAFCVLFPGGGLSNFGLLDIIAALVWVQENIHAFGGDPAKVTVAAHGTGAALLSLATISPITAQKGDFIPHSIYRYLKL